MPTKKRPYVPKTKGCHQCSRRRIHCDRTEPQCNKCVAKGLKCTGLGIKLRFCFGCSPENSEQKQGTTRSASGSNASPDLPNIDPEPMTILAEDNNDIDESEALNQLALSAKSDNVFDQLIAAIGSSISDDSNALFSPKGTCTAIGYPSTSSQSSPEFVMNDKLYSSVPDELSHWQSALLLYFSQYISPQMMAIDGTHNGWRTLVLPLARRDKLVLDAASSVAAFHIHQNRPSAYTLLLNRASRSDDSVPDPYQLYGRVIRGLQKQSGQDLCDPEQRDSILITILVLLVGVMVTGGSDYAILFRMIEAAIDASGGDQALGNGDIADFISLQFSKMKVYGAPLLGEEAGMKLLSSQHHVSKLFDCLCYRSSQYPEHKGSYAFLTDLVQQAFTMYTEEVSRPHEAPSNHFGDLDSARSIARVQHFKETLEAIPTGTPGDHMLVWAVFVAAASSILDEDKEYFEGVFMRYYLRSGFANLLSGLELLHKIWSRKEGERWTPFLVHATTFVM